jgi:hypothetical protein
MAAPEFELEPQYPILYLCEWCLDAGPEHLGTPHECQKAWATPSRVGSERKCECPCGEAYANKNRLLFYCRTLRYHARAAQREVRRARRNERAETKSKCYYQRRYYAISLREEEFKRSEATIADLTSTIAVLRQALDNMRDRVRRAEAERDAAVYNAKRLSRDFRDYKEKAAAYDKLMVPMETTKGRHIILDDES